VSSLILVDGSGFQPLKMYPSFLSSSSCLLYFTNASLPSSVSLIALPGSTSIGSPNGSLSFSPDSGSAS
jgi:hypothetical protein